jgi:glycosyltransferase involved in cell wall biosynthesis
VERDRTVWVVQTGEPVHTDHGVPRAMRGMSISDALVRRGHTVLFITTAFDHAGKHHRTRHVRRVFLPSGLGIMFVGSPGYKRNIGLGRLIDHAVLARRARKAVCGLVPPHVAFIGYPPIEVAWTVSRLLSRMGVPFIIDVKDQWPTIFVDAMPRRFRRIGQVFLHPYFLVARQALRGATGLSAMSDSFLDWALTFGGRARSSLDVVAPFTRSVILGSTAAGEPRSSRSVVLLATNIESASYDMSGMREACEHLEKTAPDVEVVVTGKIPSDSFINRVFGSGNNVRFTGMLDSVAVASILREAHFTLAPYERNDAFERSLPNKIIESLMYGVPVVSTLRGETEELIAKYDCGLVYEPTEKTSLTSVIEEIVADTGCYKRLRKGAEAASLVFDHEENYGRLAEHLEGLGRRGDFSSAHE